MTEGIPKGLDGSVWALNFSRLMSKGTLSHEELHGIWRTIKTILSLSQILNVVRIAILISATLNFVLGGKKMIYTGNLNLGAILTYLLLYTVLRKLH